MSDGIRFLTDEEAIILTRLLERERHQVAPNEGSRDQSLDFDTMTPETHVVQIPTGGISGRRGEKPGSGICTVYAILPTPTASGTKPRIVLSSVGDKSVFNIFRPPQNEGDWAVVTRDKSGKWVFAHPGPLFFCANLLARALRNGCYYYAFLEQEFIAGDDVNGPCVTQSKSSGQSGYCGASVTIERYAAGDGVGVNEIQTLGINAATSGTFDLTLEYGVVHNIAFDGSDLQAKIDAVAGSGVITVSGTSPNFQLIWVDLDAHQLATTNVTNLEPKPASPALEINNTRVTIGKNVWMTIGYPGDPELIITKTETTDMESTTTTFEVYEKDIIGGTFKLVVRGAVTDPIAWDADAADIETALNAAYPNFSFTVDGLGTEADPWVITIEEYEDFELTADEDGLLGNLDYRFFYPIEEPIEVIAKQLVCQEFWTCQGTTLRKWLACNDGSLKLLQSKPDCCTGSGTSPGDVDWTSDCSSPVPVQIAVTFGAQEPSVEGGSASTSDPACFPQFSCIVCLTKQEDYDCGGGITGIKWSGNSSCGSGYIIECQGVVTYGFGNSTCGDGAIGWNVYGSDCDGFMADLADGSLFTLLPCQSLPVTGVAGPGPCEYNCWENDTTHIRVCTGGDQSEVATQIAGPYDDSGTCATNCPPVYYCTDDGSGIPSCTAGIPFGNTSLSGPHASLSACLAVCGSWFCWTDNSKNPGESEYSVCSQSDLSATHTQYKGPFTSGAGCTSSPCTEYYCVEFYFCDDTACTVNCTPTPDPSTGVEFSENPICGALWLGADGSCFDQFANTGSGYGGIYSQILSGPYPDSSCGGGCA